MITQEFVSPRDTLDIVFANRNRAYGAYQLRRAYSRYLARALGIGLLLIGFGIVLPQILNALSNKFSASVFVDMTREIGPPPDIDPELPPPPPPPKPPTPPPPAKSIIKFVPPTPTPDEEVTEEKQRTQEEVLVADANVGTTDHKSEGAAPPILNDVPNFPREIETAAKPDDREYDMFIQKAPLFPGGDQELLKYLAENIKYPPMARENNIQGTVLLSFLIGKDGSVSDVSVLNEIGGGCGKEALRVVKAMPPWIPGEANGHAVKVRYTLPVRFRLQ